MGPGNMAPQFAGPGGGMFMFGPLGMPFGGTNQKKKKTKGAAGARRILTSFNVIFTVISLGLLGVGILFKLGNAIIIDPLTSLLDKPALEAKTAGLDGVDFNKFDLAPVLGAVATYLIGTGMCGVCLALLGMISVKTKRFGMILSYTLMLGIILFLQIAVIVIACVSRRLVDNFVMSSLASTISNGYHGYNATDAISLTWNVVMVTVRIVEYHGYNATDAISLTWNVVMVTFSCCGAGGHRDFHSARLWNRVVYQDDRRFELEAPLLCCKMATRRPGDFSCAVNPSDFNSNFEHGCYTAVIDALDNYQIYVLFGLVVVCAIQIAMFVSGIILTKDAHVQQKEKDKKDKNKEDDKDDDNNDADGRCKKTKGGNRSKKLSEDDNRSRYSTSSNPGTNIWPNIQQSDNIFRYPQMNNHASGRNSLHSLLQGLHPAGVPQPHSQDGVSALLSVLQCFPGMPGAMFSRGNPHRQPDSGGFDSPHAVYKSGNPDLYTACDESTLVPSFYAHNNNNALVPSTGYPRRVSLGSIIFEPPFAITAPTQIPQYNNNSAYEYGPIIKEVTENKMDPLLRQNTVHNLPNNVENPSSPNQVRIRKEKPPLLRCNTIA